MNYLALCQEVSRECGLSNAPTTVASQSGMLGKIVNWTNRAYEDIQRDSPHWKFRRTSKSFETIAGTDEYLSQASDVELIDPEKFSLYSSLSDEGLLWYREYNDFFPRYKLGTQNTSRPQDFTQGYDGTIILGPTPNDIYTATFHYMQKVVSLAENTDDPIIPEAHHKTIVWKACIYYANNQEAHDFLQVATQEYRTALSNLKRTYELTLSLKNVIKKIVTCNIHD